MIALAAWLIKHPLCDSTTEMRLRELTKGVCIPMMMEPLIKADETWSLKDIGVVMAFPFDNCKKRGK